jgi:hypothetical protein
MENVQKNKAREQNFLKQFSRFSTLFLMGVSLLNASEFEEYQKAQNESFQKYRDERDTAFNNYLKEQWKAYKEFSGQSLYEKPKPEIVPKVDYVAPQNLGPKVVIQLKSEPKPIVPTHEVIVPKVQTPKRELEGQKTAPKVEPKVAILTPIVTPIVVETPKKDINILFFGTQLSYNTPDGIKKAHFFPNTQAGIASFFDKAALSEYKPFLSDLQNTIKTMNLNDWGIYLLVNNLSSQIFSNQDDAKLFSWFMFNKLGYAVKVGLADDGHVIMLTYSKKIIYSTPNYTLDNKKYYALDFYNKSGVGSLYTYNQDYPGSVRPLDLAIVSLPKFVDAKNSKNLKFTYQKKEYQIPFNYNQNIIDFMATYPQADYDTYFDAPVENESYVQVASGLKKYIDGKQASDGMNFVLSFVQHAFVYQTDQQQFGREKPMFAEETLYYNASDCEDRAALYAYLTRKLFNIDVMGVKYSDHMSTAIGVPMPGDAFKVADERFVIADPTYINASIGQSMPQYKNVKPETFIPVLPSF